ncbi:hypothetical protein L2E82_48254 [Cichorium intybus]|uniref:Uncharacterized protein n=2 Tax=Cichorium intybus TaxID=13427 RepID=A0ACB8YXT3_CICIN|nr:hypothetical protein L2E82_48253 [Cichorium intybus]KAI3690275.1 hypothetical protein L2E82_48254 [Cichorium intybus]
MATRRSNNSPMAAVGGKMVKADHRDGGWRRKPTEGKLVAGVGGEGSRCIDGDEALHDLMKMEVHFYDLHPDLLG